MNQIHITLVYVLWALVTFFFMVVYLSVIKNWDNFYRDPIQGGKNRKVSVVVPAYNEEKGVKDTLESLLEISYPKELLEIIVVNDGSTDGTKEIAGNYAKDGKIILINNEKNLGKSASLNKGIEKASGELVACIDADTVVEKEIINKVMGFFDDPKTSAVVVRVKVRNPKNWMEKIIDMEYNMGLGFYLKLLSFLNCLYLTPGQFSIYRKSILIDLRGFDVNNIVEDTEIAYRMQKAHYKIACCLSAYAYTRVPDNIRSFYHQRKRWYTGTLHTVIQHHDVFFNKELGNFGMFYMPINYASSIVGVLLFISTIGLMVSSAYDFFTYYSLIGFDFTVGIRQTLAHPEFDPLSISFLYLLGLSPFIMNAAMNYFALRRMDEDIREMFFGFIFFLFFFIPYNILWMISLYFVVLNKKVKWRA